MVDLFEPLSFRNGVTSKNRLAVAPMTNQQSHDDGTLSDAEHDWLVPRGAGGFGVVETCAAFVAQDGKAWPGELGVHDDATIPGLRRLASGLRSHGAISVVQIFHGGVRAPRSVSGSQPWSASTWQEDGPTFEPPRPATIDDLHRTIAAFAAAAVRCCEAGFDGVELHGAHGYLLSQFLSATMNPRTDGWGGDLEGRMRLVREATRAVRAAVPDRFLVGVRLSPEDYGFARGIDLDDSIATAKALCDDGIDFLHLSLWDASKATKKRPEAHAVPLFRAAIAADVRILAAGSIWTRAEAEELAARGADMVALGRAAIANPDWPARATDPTWSPKRPPLTRAELRDRGLSDRFVDYMKRWKGFVDEA